MIIWEGVIIKGTLPSGVGKNLLTVDPVTGQVGSISGTPITNSLPSGQVIVGNVSNVATPVTMTGAVTISNTGVTSLGTGVIMDTNVNSSAAIAFSKMEAKTANRVPVFNGSGIIIESSITQTELSALSGVSSSIQTQLNSKQANITGAASTVVSSDLTPNRVLISNSLGKITNNSVTTTELANLSGTTSPIQTQLDGKLTVSLGSVVDGDIVIRNGNWTNLPIGTSGQVLTVVGGLPAWANGTSNGLPAGGTENQYLRKNSGTDYDAVWDTLTLNKITDVTAVAADLNILTNAASNGVTVANITYLAGVTSNIQTQLNNKVNNSLTHNSLFVGNSANLPSQLAAGAENSILQIIGGTPTWQTPPTPGNVSGPVSSTNNALVRWQGSSGNVINDSGVILDNSNALTGLTAVSIINHGALNLYKTGSTNFVSVKASAVMTSDYTITLPSAAPASNTFLKYDGTDYVWASGGAGATAFTGLSDVPSSYSGQALKGVRVNAGATGLEFYTISTGTGTVTSVGLSLPGIFSVSGSPVETTGTLTATFTTQSANTVFAGPTSGASSTPTFRSLVANDIPDLSSTYYLTSNPSGYITGNQTITLSGAVSGSGATAITTSLGTNVVGDSNLRQSVGLSVIGRNANTTGNVADITAANDGEVLRRSGTSLGFGALNLASTNAVTGVLTPANGGTGLPSYTTGDLIFASGATTLDKLAAVATGSVLGSAGAGTAPGYLAVSNGMTATASTLKFGGALTANTDLSGAFTLSMSDAASQLVLGASTGTANTRLDIIASTTHAVRIANSSNATMILFTGGGRMAWGGGVTNYIAAANGGSEVFTGGGLRFVAANRGFYFNNSGSNLNNADDIISIGGSLTSSANTSANNGVFRINAGLINSGAFTNNTFRVANINPTLNLSTGTNTVELLNIQTTDTSIVGLTTLYGVRVFNTNALNGFGVTAPTAILHLAGSSTSRASFRIASGTAPTSPNDGDMWYDGTNVYFRVGGTTKTFTLI